METENSQSLSLCSSSLPPPQDSVESFIFVSLISNYGLRYEGVLYHLNLHDSTLALQNVMCYGTEGRNDNGFQILPSPDVYSYIIFSTSQIKDILVKPPVSFTHCCLARGALSSKLPHATKPQLPIIFSPYNPHGAKLRQKVPLISNEKLDKPETTTDYDVSLVHGSVSDGLQIASNPFAQPQFPGSDFYDTWSDHVYQTMPCGALHQAPPINADLPDEPYASAFAPQSFFTTFPPVPISLKQVDGGFEFEALNKNFKQYDVWRGNNNQRDQNIEGSVNMISRNPFGPIARPVKHTEEISNSLQRRHQLQPPLSNFRG